MWFSVPDYTAFPVEGGVKGGDQGRAWILAALTNIATTTKSGERRTMKTRYIGLGKRKSAVPHGICRSKNHRRASPFSLHLQPCFA